MTIFVYPFTYYVCIHTLNDSTCIPFGFSQESFGVSRSFWVKTDRSGRPTAKTVDLRVRRLQYLPRDLLNMNGAAKEHQGNSAVIAILSYQVLLSSLTTAAAASCQPSKSRIQRRGMIR